MKDLSGFADGSTVFWGTRNLEHPHPITFVTVDRYSRCFLAWWGPPGQHHRDLRSTNPHRHRTTRCRRHIDPTAGDLVKDRFVHRDRNSLTRPRRRPPGDLPDHGAIRVPVAQETRAHATHHPPVRDGWLSERRATLRHNRWLHFSSLWLSVHASRRSAGRPAPAASAWRWGPPRPPSPEPGWAGCAPPRRPGRPWPVGCR